MTLEISHNFLLFSQALGSGELAKYYKSIEKVFKAIHGTRRNEIYG